MELNIQTGFEILMKPQTQAKTISTDDPNTDFTMELADLDEHLLMPVLCPARRNQLKVRHKKTFINKQEQDPPRFKSLLHLFHAQLLMGKCPHGALAPLCYTRMNQITELSRVSNRVS